MENQEINNLPQSEKKSAHKIIWKIFFYLVFFIGFLIFGLMFLFTPGQIKQGDDILFKNNGYFFSEKISYLFREPRTGDRVVFKTFFQDSFEKDYVGLIVEIRQGRTSTEYLIRLKSISSNPWVVTRDKIKSRIYFPLISETLKQEIISEGAWKITPSLIPMQLPISIIVKDYNKVLLPSDWLNFKSKNQEYSFFYPPNLKEEVNSYEGNVTFSLTDKNSEEMKYLEIFVKKIALKPDEDAGSVIYKDTGLSSVPTFQKVVINNSISGFEISRSVDNLSRLLRVVYLPGENSVYSISMRTPLPIKDSSYEEIFEKIVGSFKFGY